MAERKQPVHTYEKTVTLRITVINTPSLQKANAEWHEWLRMMGAGERELVHIIIAQEGKWNVIR